jgi:hypothetical protein
MGSEDIPSIAVIGYGYPISYECWYFRIVTVAGDQALVSPYG